MAADRHIILILGMHRSGTSAVTRLLNLLGARIGQNLLPGQPQINARGFWENKAVVDLDERLLEALNTTWFDFRPLPPQWWRSLKIAPIRHEIKAALETEFPENGLFVLKDPRMCRLLPLWLDVLAELQFQSRCLLVLREPGEVADSLQKRDGFSRESGFGMWLTHVAESEAFSKTVPRTLVTYDELLASPEKTANRIAADLDVKWPQPFAQIRAVVATEINPDLKHHARKAALVPDTAMPLEKWAHTIYTQAISSMSDWPVSLLDEFRDALSAPASPETLMSRALFQANKALVRQSRELARIGEAHAHALETLKARDAQIENLGQQHEKALAIIRERDAQIREFDTRLSRIGQEHTQALSIIQERDAQIREFDQRLSDIGQAHAQALSVIRERDDQIREFDQRLSDIGQKHTYALTVIDERDAQVAELTYQVKTMETKLKLLQTHWAWPVIKRLL